MPKKINAEILEWIFEMCFMHGFMEAHNIKAHHTNNIIKHLLEKANVKRE